MMKPVLKCVVQHYSRDLFLFLYLLLVLASALTSLKKHVDKSIATGKSILYLNRHQTEEWKGWMQVCFISSVSDNLEEIVLDCICSLYLFVGYVSVYSKDQIVDPNLV